MKKIISLVVAMVMTLGITQLSAATKQEKTVIETTKFSVNINCADCEKKIMNYIPYQKGVESVTIDSRNKVATVVYNSKKASTSSIIKYFKKIDFVASVYTEPRTTATQPVTTTTTSKTTTPATTSKTTTTTTTTSSPDRR